MFDLSQSLKVKVVNIDKKICLIIDNFYKDPDKVRQYAINSKKYNDPELIAGLIGRRVCEDDLRLSYYMKDVFQELCKYPKWHINFDKNHHDYKWSGMRFMVNVTNNQEILIADKEHIEHVDGDFNKWACVVYLNKEHECEGGTSFYSWNGEDSSWPKLEYTAKMKYNRAVLYDANQIHGAVMNKNMFKKYDRLVQVMFM